MPERPSGGPSGRPNGEAQWGGPVGGPVGKPVGGSSGGPCGEALWGAPVGDPVGDPVGGPVGRLPEEGHGPPPPRTPLTSDHHSEHRAPTAPMTHEEELPGPRLGTGGPGPHQHIRPRPALPLRSPEPNDSKTQRARGLLPLLLVLPDSGGRRSPRATGGPEPTQPPRGLAASPPGFSQQGQRAGLPQTRVVRSRRASSGL